MKKPGTRFFVCGGLVLAGVAVAAAGYLAFVAPQRTEAQRLSGQIATAESELVTGHVSAAPQSPEATEIFRLTKAMPSTNDMPGILLDLSRVASASSVTLTSVHPSPTVQLASGYAALPLSIVVSGKYAGIADFLRRLRESARFDGPRLDVSSRLFLANQLQLAAGTGSSVDATLSLDAFVYGAPPSPVSTAGPSVDAAGGH